MAVEQPGEIVANVLRYRWGKEILRALAREPMRHSHLLAYLGQLGMGTAHPKTMLSAIRLMEHERLVVSRHNQPHTTTYAITRAGQEVLARLLAMEQDSTDTTTPGSPTAAGMYDYYLGGSAHSLADRAAAERIAELIPQLDDSAWANRGFLQRAVKQMASQWGIRQFIDIGSGLPTQRNTHDVVAEATPHGRVVYVDIDPAVVKRAQDILGGAQGATVIQGDARQPETIFDHPDTRRLIDLSAPVGLLLVAVLHFVPDDDDPWALVARYRDRLVAGSYMALSHPSVGNQVSDEVRRTGTQIAASMDTPPTDRSKTEIERFFQGMEIVPAYPGAAPGVVHVGLWGAEDPEHADSDGSRLGFAGVARIT